MNDLHPRLHTQIASQLSTHIYIYLCVAAHGVPQSIGLDGFGRRDRGAGRTAGDFVCAQISLYDKPHLVLHNKLVELAPFVWLTMAYIGFRDYLHTPMNVSTALRHVVIS